MTSNDPVQPQVYLTLKVELDVTLELEPRIVNFRSVTRGSGATETVRLYGRDAASTKLLEATFQQQSAGKGSSNDPAVLVVKRLDEGDGSGAIELSVTPNAPAGPFFGRLVVKTDHATTPQLTLAVRGTIEGAVSVRPNRLSFRVDEEGKTQTRALTVTGPRDGPPVKVLEVQTDHPGLEASFSEIAGGQTRITVTCNGQMRRDREVAKLLIRTSSPEDPRVEVPVQLARMKPPAVPSAASSKPD